MSETKAETQLDIDGSSYVAPAQSEFGLHDPDFTRQRPLRAVRRQLRRILVFVVACVVATSVISSRLRRVYEATAAIELDRSMPNSVIGQDSGRMGAVFDSEQYLATQIKLVQTDAVLRPVAQRFRLFAAGSKNQAAVPGLRVSRPANSYILQISCRADSPQAAADIANAVAESYVARTYELRIRSHRDLSAFMNRQIEELRAKMERSASALARFDRELSAINPEEKVNILSARLLQLNTEYTVSQGERVRKEAVLNSVRSGSLEAAQVSGQGDGLAQLLSRLNDGRQRVAEIGASYGPEHPEMRKALSHLAEIERQVEEARRNIANRVVADYRQALGREEALRRAVTQTKTECDRISSRSFEYQQMKQNASADKKLYDELVSKINEGGINAGFQNPNVRIADAARPGVVVFPNTTQNLVIALAIASFLAVSTAVVVDALDSTVRDRSELARLSGGEILAALPDVGDPLFVESLRMLRNTMLLRNARRPARSLLVTAAAPGEGRTTVAIHLAAVHAEANRTLLLDAATGRPTIHLELGLPADPGLPSILSGERDWRETVAHVDELPSLDVIPGGTRRGCASSPVGPQLERLLEDAGADYDLVVIDAPPILNRAECLEMAAVVDAVLVVCAAGRTERKALAEALSRLRRMRANLLGVVLNRAGDLD